MSGSIQEYTSNYKFEIPAFDFPNWHTYYARSLKTIDSLFYQISGATNLKGAWQNSTAYVAGDRVIDTDNNTTYVANLDHTSAASPTTFAEDRTANPTYWSVSRVSPSPRGDWVTATLYFQNDFVKKDSAYYVCEIQHTSGTFATDLAASKWTLLLDWSAADTDVTNAAASASAASTSEGNALTYKNAAAASASAASTSEGNALTYKNDAAASAAAASTSEGNALTYEASASASASSALSSWTSFKSNYLGSHATDPTTDLDGNPLAVGMLYYDSTNHAMKDYNGTAWEAAYLPASSYLATTDLATQAEAEAGVLNTKWMSPLRVKQAIDARSPAGGAASTTSATPITLTNASVRNQRITMTAASQHVTLPDATTLVAGGPIFSIANAGNHSFAVRRNDASILIVVAPGGSVNLYLDDISTARGTWRFMPDMPEHILAAHRRGEFYLSSTYTNWNAVVPIALSATSFMFFPITATNTYAGVVDASTYPATIGTPVSIDAIVTQFYAVAMSATVVQVFWQNSTNAKSAILSVSGTTVTVNAIASKATTYSGGAAGNGQQAVAGTYSVFANAISNVLTIIPFNYSGTTAYIGNVVTFGTNAVGAVVVVGVYPLDATHVLIVYIDDSGTVGTPYSLRAVVVTMSGSTTPTATVGTSAGVNDVMVAPSTIYVSVVAHSATLFTLTYRLNTDNTPYVVGVSISGTTVTFGTPVQLENVALYSEAPILTKLSATTALAYWRNAANYYESVVITNTAGVITFGSINYYNYPNGSFVYGNASGYCVSGQNSGSHILKGFSISGTTIAQGGQVFHDDLGYSYYAINDRFGVVNTNESSEGARAFIVDISNPAVPVYVGEYVQPGSSANYVVGLGNTIFATRASTQSYVGSTSTPYLVIYEGVTRT